MAATARSPSRELRFSRITDLARLLRARKVSALELTRDALTRLEAEGPGYNAVAELTPDLAEEQARRADRALRKGAESRLTGVPYGAKDMLPVKGVPTRWGSAAFADQVFDYDAAVIERLRAAGAPLAAKLTMVEFGGPGGYRNARACATGPVLNPWDRSHWAGGSSSGSAAAVAAGLVPFALGADTMGSLMTPSAFCGVTGFRPSFGAVSNFGAMELAWSMDRIGPIARSAEDCALIAAHLIGKDPRDPISVDVSLRPSRLRRKQLRVGVLASDLSFAPATAGALDDAIRVFRGLGARIRRVALPDRNYIAIGRAIIAGEVGAAHEAFIRSPGLKLFQDDVQQRGVGGFLTQPLFAYVRALHERAYAVQEIRGLFRDLDVVLAPTAPGESPSIDTDLTVGAEIWRGPFASIGALAGLPAVSVPMGFGPKRLPLGMAIIGDLYADATVLRVAAMYQSETDWHDRHPDLS